MSTSVVVTRMIRHVIVITVVEYLYTTNPLKAQSDFSALPSASEAEFNAYFGYMSGRLIMFFFPLPLCDLAWKYPRRRAHIQPPGTTIIVPTQTIHSRLILDPLSSAGVADHSAG